MMNNELSCSESKVITVFSTTGGIGKTTIAINLAADLYERYQEKVCIVDIDLQFGDVANYLGLTPRYTIADFAEYGWLEGINVTHFLTEWQQSIDVLAAPHDYQRSKKVSADVLEYVIKSLRREYRFVIIDTAVSFDETILSAIDCADNVLIIGSIDSISRAKNLKIGFDTLHSLGYDDNKLRIILNSHKAKTLLDIREVERLLGRSFAIYISKDADAVATSEKCYMPFVINNPGKEISRQIVSLGKMITGECFFLGGSGNPG